MSKSPQPPQNRFAAFSSKERYLINEGLLHTFKALVEEHVNDDTEELQSFVEELTLLLAIMRDVRDKRFKDEWNNY
jgi:hypothetical protein